MTTNIYDSSSITKRRRDKTIAGSFIRRITNPTNPTTGSAPLLGITEQSIINTVKTGQMTEYRKNEGGCVFISPGCPCDVEAIIEASTQPFVNTYWFTKILGTSTLPPASIFNIGYTITNDPSNNIYLTGGYNSNTLELYTPDDQITPSPISVTGNNNGFYNGMIVKYDIHGNILWATKIGDNLADTLGRSIVTDSLNNVYTTGYYRSNPLTIFSYNAPSLPYTLSNDNTALFDIYVAEYNSDGLALWAAKIGGVNPNNGQDVSFSIITDSANNVYVAGQYLSNPLYTYDAGGITQTIPTMVRTGNADGFIVKYNSSGVALWAAHSGGAGNACTFSQIKNDSLNNIYGIGHFNCPTLSVFNQNGTVGATLTQLTGDDIFVVKYDSNGTVLWATKIGGSGTDQGHSIVVDSSNNIYVLGLNISSVLQIFSASNQATPTIQANRMGTSSDVFVVKYDPNGNALWVASVAAIGQDFGRSITLDTNNNIYFTGYYANTLTLYNSLSTPGPSPYPSSGITIASSGNRDVFVVKYDSNGNALWGTRISGSGSDDQGWSISTNSFNDVYVTGQFNSPTLDIYNSDTTLAGTIQGNTNGLNTFLVKYDSNGILVP